MTSNQAFCSTETTIEHRRNASKNLGGLGAGPHQLPPEQRRDKGCPAPRKEFKNVYF
jgi:hypothetical protein